MMTLTATGSATAFELGRNPTKRPRKGFWAPVAQSLIPCCTALALVLLACPTANAQASQATVMAPRPTEHEIQARASKLLSLMTAEEKAAQLTQYFYLQPYPAANAQSLNALATTGVGSLLFVTDPAETNRLQRIALEKSRLKIPILFGYDVIHGFRTIFPVPIGMAASWDPALVERTQAVAAAEARAVGIHWAFAPMLDVSRDPRWGRMVEGAGEDPFLTSAMGAAQVRGFQGPYIGAPGHILAGPKHLAGYGASMGGRDYAEVNLSDSELWNVYLPPFKAAIDAGAGNIMSAYMPLNGVPAAGNRWLLTTVLRDTWGFKGFVVSDSGGVGSLKTQGVAASDEDAAVLALKSGLTLEMTGPMGTPAMRALPQALKDGRVSTKEVDKAVRQILETKIRLGLFENPLIDETKVAGVLNDPAHLDLARVAAERSAVLLRNEGAILPLSASSLRSIAVIGPLADSHRDILGSWAFTQNNPPSVTVLEGIKAKLGDRVRVEYSEGVRIPPRLFPAPGGKLDPKEARAPLDETAEIARAVALARQTDATVLVLGEAKEMTGETASRTTFALPGRQQELLEAVSATGKPVVVVLMSGRPVDLAGSKAPAILDVWYPGSRGGPAVANLLFGDATPGGKLPFTWISDAAQSPNPYAHYRSHKPQDAEKGYFNAASTPTYPFGYGLSYTRFAYDNVRVERARYRLGETVTVTVDLKNIGQRDGDEVAQLYIHQRLGGAQRPVRELKGFERVSLRAGEVKTLRFELKPQDLSYWSPLTRSWIQEASAFDVWVGGDSSAQAAGTFEIAK